MSQSHSDRTPRNARRPVGPPMRRDPALPRYRLILHSNPSLDLMFVVRSVMELTRFPRAEATHKMWEAHHGGRSILLTTWLERAELYVEQFADKGLNTSIEPA
jgi:ATP-dependent Clp protease adapter protein ClpS